jgi:hypothetical protein
MNKTSSPTGGTWVIFVLRYIPLLTEMKEEVKTIRFVIENALPAATFNNRRRIIFPAPSLPATAVRVRFFSPFRPLVHVPVVESSPRSDWMLPESAGIPVKFAYSARGRRHLRPVWRLLRWNFRMKS